MYLFIEQTHFWSWMTYLHRDESLYRTEGVLMTPNLASCNSVETYQEFLQHPFLVENHISPLLRIHQWLPVCTTPFLLNNPPSTDCLKKKLPLCFSSPLQNALPLLWPMTSSALISSFIQTSQHQICIGLTSSTHTDLTRLQRTLYPGLSSAFWLCWGKFWSLAPVHLTLSLCAYVTGLVCHFPQSSALIQPLYKTIKSLSLHLQDCPVIPMIGFMFSPLPCPVSTILLINPFQSNHYLNDTCNSHRLSVEAVQF